MVTSIMKMIIIFYRILFSFYLKKLFFVKIYFFGGII